MVLDEQRIAIERALILVSREQADVLIEEPSQEYVAVIQAGKALAEMLWAMARANGTVENENTLRMMAQGEAILLALLHNAWALGVKQERGRAK